MMFSFPEIRLESDRLLMQTLDESAVQEVFEYLRKNQLHFASILPILREGWLTRPNIHELLRNERFARDNGDSIRIYMVWNRGSQKMVIGDVSLANRVMGGFKSASIGFKIDKDFQGEGIMREALKVLIPYFFREFGLERLEANVHPENNRSILLVRKMGFHLDGRSPQFVRLRNSREDHLRFSLAKNHWDPEGDQMLSKGLKPCFPNLFSGIRLRHYQYEGTLVLVAVAEGRYRKPPKGQLDANYIFRSTAEIFQNIRACGLIWDFRGLDFYEGEEMLRVLTLPAEVGGEVRDGSRIPVGIVVSDLCRTGMARLLKVKEDKLPWNFFEDFDLCLKEIEREARQYLYR